MAFFPFAFFFAAVYSDGLYFCLSVWAFRCVQTERWRAASSLAVMAALVEWAAERGATTAYLQVLGDNAPALALYDRLGFVEHHRYRYLAAPSRP